MTGPGYYPWRIGVPERTLPRYGAVNLSDPGLDSCHLVVFYHNLAWTLVRREKCRVWGGSRRPRCCKKDTGVQLVRYPPPT